MANLDNSIVIQWLETSQIDNPATNPNHMDPETVDALKMGIKRHGFLQPLLVRPRGDRFEIVDGCHRFAAATECGYTTLPCVVKETGDDVASLLQISMNRLRGNLDLMEVATSVDDMLDAGLTLDDLMVTGFSEDELRDMHSLAKAIGPEDDLLGDVLSLPDPDPRDMNRGKGEFVLEIHFENRDQMADVRRLLRRAGGGDIVAGILHLVGLDD